MQILVKTVAFFKVGRGGADHFSSWMLNDELNLTVLERGGRHFFKVQGGGGEAKLKPETDTPELGFKDSIAWSLIFLKYNKNKLKNNSLTQITHAEPIFFGLFE